MLKALRGKKAKKAMLVVLILIIPSFVLFYGWSEISRRQYREQVEYARFSPPGAYRLWFKDWRKWHEITRTDLVSAQRQILNRLSGFVGRQTVSQWERQYGRDSFVPREAMMQQALNDYVLREYAEKMGVSVPEEELTMRVAGQLRGVPRQYWMAVIQDAGYPDEQSFVNAIREQARMEKAELGFIEQANVSLFEAWDSYRLEKEEIALDVVSFGLIEFRKEVEVTDEALRDYFTENQEDFRVGDQRRYRYAYLKKKSLADSVQVTSEAARRHYEDNRDKYQVGARLKLRRIVFDVEPSASVEETTKTFQTALAVRRRIDAGEDFAKLADELTQADDNLTADGKTRGGLLDRWVSQKDVREFGYPMLSAALQLQKGEVAGPVRTTGRGISGYVIVKAEDRKEAGILPFEEAAEQAMANARQAAIDAAFKERTQEIAAKVDAYSTLDGMAEELGMNDGLTSWVLVDSPFLTADLGFIKKDNIDFIQTLQVGEPSGLLYGTDMIFVVRPLEEKPSHIPLFEEIRDDIESAYRDAKGREAMERAARAFHDSLASDARLTSAARKASLDFTRTPPFKRSDMTDPSTMPGGLPAPIVDFPLLSYSAEEGDIGLGKAAYGEGEALAWVVWQVRDLETPSMEDFQKESGPYLGRQVFAGHQRMLNGWLHDRRNAMRLKINERWVP